MPPVVKIKHGRPVVEDPKIKAWRMRNKRYQVLKAEIIAMLSAKGWDTAKVKEWLNTPTRGLKNRCPKQLMNPTAIAVLHNWARKVLCP